MIRKIQGNRQYKNKAELEFQLQAYVNGVKILRRGYPDYIILDSKNEIAGFVEVKPNGTKDLRKGQKIFKSFCEKNGIPFYKWTPEDHFPDRFIGL